MAQHFTNGAATRQTAAQAWKLMIDFFQAQRCHFERAAAEFDLTKQQSHVVHLLAKEGPRSSRELAGVLGCDASNVTGLIDRLAARNLVTRKLVPGDRRMRMLALTPAGVRLYRRLVGRMSAAPPAIAALDPDEQRALRDIMARALAHARETAKNETSARSAQYPYQSTFHKS